MNSIIRILIVLLVMSVQNGFSQAAEKTDFQPEPLEFFEIEWDTLQEIEGYTVKDFIFMISGPNPDIFVDYEEKDCIYKIIVMNYYGGSYDKGQIILQLEPVSKCYLSPKVEDYYDLQPLGIQYQTSDKTEDQSVYYAFETEPNIERWKRNLRIFLAPDSSRTANK